MLESLRHFKNEMIRKNGPDDILKLQLIEINLRKQRAFALKFIIDKFSLIMNNLVNPTSITEAYETAPTKSN